MVYHFQATVTRLQLPVLLVRPGCCDAVELCVRLSGIWLLELKFTVSSMAIICALQPTYIRRCSNCKVVSQKWKMWSKRLCVKIDTRRRSMRNVVTCQNLTWSVSRSVVSAWRPILRLFFLIATMPCASSAIVNGKLPSVCPFCLLCTVFFYVCFTCTSSWYFVLLVTVWMLATHLSEELTATWNYGIMFSDSIDNFIWNVTLAQKSALKRC